MRLVEPPELLDDPAGHDAEVARVPRNLDVAEPRDHPVAELGDRALDRGLSLAGPPFGVHDFVALAKAGVHLGDQLGRILQVDVDHGARGAPAEQQTGHRGAGLAEPPGEDDQPDVRVAMDPLEDDLLGSVGAGIEAEDDLVRAPQPRQDRLDPLEERCDIVLFLEDRHHDGQVAAGGVASACQAIRHR